MAHVWLIVCLGEARNPVFFYVPFMWMFFNLILSSLLYRSFSDLICVLNLRLENKENGCTLGVYPIFEKISTSRTRLKINFFTVWLRLVCDIGAESAPLVGIGLRYPPNLPTCKQPCPISQTFWGLANNQWNNDREKTTNSISQLSATESRNLM